MKSLRLWIKRWRYRLDNWFSNGPTGPVLGLGALSLVIVAASTIFLVRTGLAPEGEGGYNLLEAFWTSLVRIIGGGGIGLRGTPWGFRLLMFCITLASIFVVSLLIGTLTNTISGRILELRKGRSEVMESDHIIILGWNSQVFSIVSELAAANESRKGACIAVMAQQDKTFMEDRLRQKLGKNVRTRIVCRTGNPMEPDDLKIINLNASRAIVVLSPESENPDADVIKTVLAITNQSNRRSQPFQIVAGIRDPKNMEVARVAGRHEVEWINVGNMVARVIAQTSRQCGLSVVISDLLNFGGSEIYFHEDQQLVGKRFGDVLSMYEHDSVLGLVSADGQPHLNPAQDRLIQPGDRAIVIASDDNTTRVTSTTPVLAQESAVSLDPLPQAKPVRTLLLGWNWRAPIVLAQLDHYVCSGSEVVVMSDQKGLKTALESVRTELKNQKVSLRRGDITDRATLEAQGLEKFNHIILLSQSETVLPQQADARSLITLLHLRDLADVRMHRYTITSEMMDDRNRKLAMVTRADDFIVSERLVSLMMAQVAENRAVNRVFADLLDAHGSEIYLKPAASFVKLGQPVNFYTVVESARRRGEIAFGYRLGAFSRDPQNNFGIVLNPRKNDTVSFGDRDRVIVLSAQ